MERRCSTRKNLYLSIALEIPAYNHRIVAATLNDLSVLGAFIETQVLLPENAALTVEFKLPGSFAQTSFRLNARIVRRTSRGVGVEFVGIPVSTAHALSEALSLHEKQLGPFNPDILCGFAMTNKLAI